ncbi:MAG: LPS assembly lipoprotein LptE [Phycisphaerales bacterium]|nr:LPS assembly lipoprotein LptE [Phycisphaerales bacterium]
MKLCCLILALATSLVHVGCSKDPSKGWAMGSTHPEAYSTVAVPLFVNSTYDRGLERDLGQALVSEIEATTPYKVTGTGKADTMLRGTITGSDLRQISKSVTTGLALETLYQVTIDFEWVDLATGEPIAARNRMSSTAMFTSSRPAQEPRELARFQVVQQLARDLVDAMRANW